MDEVFFVCSLDEIFRCFSRFWVRIHESLVEIYTPSESGIKYFIKRIKELNNLGCSNSRDFED